MEAMIASVLLATCVVGISGALIAAAQNQSFAVARRASSVDGRKQMENVLALPMDPTTSGQASIADYKTAKTTSSGSTISIDRRSTLNGTASTTGDFAVVSVVVPVTPTNGRASTITIKRLVTAAEATANRTP